MANEAVTPPVVGSVSTAMYRSPASLWRLTAPEHLAICMRDTTPSCIRAPPEAVKPMTGRRWASANSNRRVIFSPTAEPMEAMIKLESMTNVAQDMPPMAAVPHRTASFSPVVLRAFSSFSA